MGRIVNVLLRVHLNARKATIIAAILLVFCLPNDRESVKNAHSYMPIVVYKHRLSTFLSFFDYYTLAVANIFYWKVL